MAGFSSVYGSKQIGQVCCANGPMLYCDAVVVGKRLPLPLVTLLELSDAALSLRCKPLGRKRPPPQPAAPDEAGRACSMERPTSSAAGAASSKAGGLALPSLPPPPPPSPPVTVMVTVVSDGVGAAITGAESGLVSRGAGSPWEVEVGASAVLCKLWVGGGGPAGWDALVELPPAGIWGSEKKSRPA